MQSLKSASSLFYTTFLFVLSGCITGCEKSNYEPHDTLEPNGLSYIQIPVGKYFIYEDSATAKLDSIVVTESKMEVLHTNSSYITGASSYEVYRLTLTDKTTGTDTVWLKGAAAAAYSSTKFSMLSQTRNSYDDYLFRYPLSAYGGIFPNDRVLSSFIVEGKTYSQVILTTGIYDTSSKFYWAKGTGLIRYEQGGTSPKTYTLVRNG